MGWVLSAIFLLAAIPHFHRLSASDLGNVNRAERNGDVADILLALAMASMVLPWGNFIPPAGWQALLLVALTWFCVQYGRHEWPGWENSAYYVISTLAMIYLFSLMPDHAAMAGDAASAARYDGFIFWPATILLCGYFIFDLLRAIFHVSARKSRHIPVWKSGMFSRVVMSSGMGYMFVSLW